MAVTAKQTTQESDVLLTPEQSWERFDQQVRALMDGMTGDEFIRRWDAGEFREIADRPGHRHIMRLALLMPAGEQEP